MVADFDPANLEMLSKESDFDYGSEHPKVSGNTCCQDRYFGIKLLGLALKENIEYSQYKLCLEKCYKW